MIEGEGKEGFFKKLVLDVTGVVKERIIGNYFSEMKGCYGKAFALLAVYSLILAASAITIVGPLIIAGPMTLGLSRGFLELARKKKTSFSVLFSGFKDFKRAFCTFLLVALKTALWTLLFVVPGIIAAIRYSLSFFVLADNPDIKARDAIEKSKQMMKGKKLKYCIVSICFTTFYGWFYLSSVILGALENLNLDFIEIIYLVLGIFEAVYSVLVSPVLFYALIKMFYPDVFNGMQEETSEENAAEESVKKEPKPKKERKPLSKKAKKIIAGSFLAVILAVLIYLVFGLKIFYTYKPKMIKIPGQHYEMMSSEVTQDLYESVTGRNPSVFSEEFKAKYRPVESVSWYDAIYFCNLLSKSEGLEPVYAVNGKKSVSQWNYKPHRENEIEGKITQDVSANGYRLPTLEEWQYAAKGGEDYSYAGSDNINKVAWYEENSGGTTHPAAQKKANGYGLYDMSGNVDEWCWDVDPYDGYDRYYCGDNWDVDAYNCSVGFRGSSGPSYRCDISGFRPVRTVITAPKMVKIPEQEYEMMTTEVTQGLYCAVMGENPSFYQTKNIDAINKKYSSDCDAEDVLKNGSLNNPVDKVSWYDAICFCNRLSIKTGLTPVYVVDGETDPDLWDYTPHTGDQSLYEYECEISVDSGADGYRLPSYEEWNYAAKGGQDYKYAGSDDIEEVCWYKDNAGNTTHPVGQKKPNGYGLYDMGGNVSEWCGDSYKLGNDSRIYCGNDWASSVGNCTVTNGMYCEASNYYINMGFRLARGVIKM